MKRSWLEKVREAQERKSPRRPIELIAIAPDVLGKKGLGIAVTISQHKGMIRKVISHGDSPEDLTKALREAADWIETYATGT